MTNIDQILYSQSGKSTKGTHAPFTCPFCGPGPRTYIPDEARLTIMVERHVSIPTDPGRTERVTIVSCSSCSRVLSVIPEEAS